jgi:hypothetical protein
MTRVDLSKHMLLLLVAASITSVALADSSVKILNSDAHRKGLSGIAASFTTSNMTATR